MNNFYVCFYCDMYTFPITWYDGSTFNSRAFVAFKQGSAFILKNNWADAVEGTIKRDKLYEAYWHCLDC